MNEKMVGSISRGCDALAAGGLSYATAVRHSPAAHAGKPRETAMSQPQIQALEGRDDMAALGLSASWQRLAWTINGKKRMHASNCGLAENTSTSNIARLSAH